MGQFVTLTAQDGHRLAASRTGPEDARAGIVVIQEIFGVNAHIRAVAERGEVWTIDPVFTETAKFSTRHIAAWPGKDYAILAWLVREIIDGGPLDLAQPVDGLDELRALLATF